MRATASPPARSPPPYDAHWREAASRRRARWRRGPSRTPGRRAAIRQARTTCRAPFPACRCRAGRRAGRLQRDLHQPRAIDAPATSCRPTDRARRGTPRPRRRNPAAVAVIGARCTAGRCQPAGGDGEAFVLLRDGDPRAHRQRGDRRQLDVGPRESQRARHQRPCASAPAPAAQRVGRQPADIAVGLELAPGPAFLGRLVDDDALAKKRLRVEPRLVRGRAAQTTIGSITSWRMPSTKRAASTWPCRYSPPARGGTD